MYASGAEKMPETNNYKLNLTGLRIPTGRRQTSSWLFTSVAKDLNLGLP